LQVVASGPDVAGDALYDGILSFIQEAKRRIWIITPYFIPDEVLFRSLLVKARTGHEVKLVVPARSNHPIADHARRYYLRELQKAGAQVLLFQPGMMHSKGMIVDDRIGLLGSANFDLRSLFVNFEIGVFVYSEPEVRAMRAWAQELIVHCKPLTAAKSSRRRLLGNIAEDLSRLLAPML
jgi:cardiolipin synthase